MTNPVRNSDKISFDLRARVFCEGCGTVHQAQVDMPVYLKSDLKLISSKIETAIGLIEQLNCPICKERTASISFHEETPKRSKKQDSNYKKAKEFRL